MAKCGIRHDAARRKIFSANLLTTILLNGNRRLQRLLLPTRLAAPNTGLAALRESQAPQPPLTRPAVAPSARPIRLAPPPSALHPPPPQKFFSPNA